MVVYEIVIHVEAPGDYKKPHANRMHVDITDYVTDMLDSDPSLGWPGRCPVTVTVRPAAESPAEVNEPEEER